MSVNIQQKLVQLLNRNNLFPDTQLIELATWMNYVVELPYQIALNRETGFYELTKKMKMKKKRKKKNGNQK